MNCNEIRDLLPLYAGGELEEDARGSVDSHLIQCAACANELDRHRETRSTLASLREDDQTPIALWGGIRAELFPRPSNRPRPLLDDLLRAAACLVAGLALGSFFHRSFTDRPETPSASSPSEVTAFRPGGGPSVGAETRPVAERQGPGFGMQIEIHPEHSFYLPRVDALSVTGEKDF